MISWELQPVTGAFVAANPFTEDVEAVRLEYLKFMSIVAENPGVSLGMSGVVDKYWHEHILYTQDYRNFCNRKVGYFVDHAPGSTPIGEEFLERYRRTIRLLSNKFGEVNTRIWPTVEDLEDGFCSGGNCGNSCSKD
tara:strand:+ start:4520 stop:4930 length:411 start_codon:yes stop_codon:yes gene_type:complete